MSKDPDRAGPYERLLWNVEKDGRKAQSTVREVSDGLELRIAVGAELLASRLFERDPALLEQSSNGIRQKLIGKGWSDR